MSMRHVGTALYWILLAGGAWSIAAGIEVSELEKIIGGAILYLIGRDAHERTR